MNKLNSINSMRNSISKSDSNPINNNRNSLRNSITNPINNNRNSITNSRQSISKDDSNSINNNRKSIDKIKNFIEMNKLNSTRKSIDKSKNTDSVRKSLTKVKVISKNVESRLFSPSVSERSKTPVTSNRRPSLTNSPHHPPAALLRSSSPSTRMSNKLSKRISASPRRSLSPSTGKIKEKMNITSDYQLNTLDIDTLMNYINSMDDKDDKDMIIQILENELLQWIYINSVLENNILVEQNKIETDLGNVYKENERRKMKYYESLITFNKYKLLSIYNNIINKENNELYTIIKNYDEFKRLYLELVNEVYLCCQEFEIKNVSFDSTNLLKELDECYTLCLKLDNIFVGSVNDTNNLNNNLKNLKNELLNINSKMKIIDNELKDINEEELYERSLKIVEIEKDNINLL